MRKFAGLALAVILLFSVAMKADVLTKQDFLSTAVATITTGATATNGTDFTSASVTLGQRAASVVGIMVTFTRATGSASTLDVNFQVSWDGGTTWADYDDGEVQVSTNHTAITGTTVRYFTLLGLYGANAIRLHTLKNNDSGSITAVNVSISTSTK